MDRIGRSAWLWIILGLAVLCLLLAVVVFPLAGPPGADPTQARSDEERPAAGPDPARPGAPVPTNDDRIAASPGTVDRRPLPDDASRAERDATPVARSLDDAGAGEIERTLREAIRAAETERGVSVAAGLVDALLAEGAVDVIVTRRPAALRVDAEVRGTRHADVRYLRNLPIVSLEVGPQALANLLASGDVLAIGRDGLHRPSLAVSTELIGANAAHALDFDGRGLAIAVLDTGVDLDHPFFEGRIVAEACFSKDLDCPNGEREDFGAGSAASCTYSSSCYHGSAVSGIALGDDPATDRHGVAPAAELIAIQVFSNVAGDPLAYTSDLLAALDHVYDLRLDHEIASVNMSLGGDEGFTSQSECDSENGARKALIDLLRAVDIPTVVSSGNDGWTDKLSAPACISSAISVGWSTKTDVIDPRSNSAPFLSLVAPGSLIETANRVGGYSRASGTSMAAPHVAGAWAILRNAFPDLEVGTGLEALRKAAVLVPDPRDGSSRPRIDVMGAIEYLDENGEIGTPPGGSPSGSVTTSRSRERCGLVGLELLFAPLLAAAWRRARSRA